MVYQGASLLGNGNHSNSYTNFIPNYRSEVIYFSNSEVKSRNLFFYIHKNFPILLYINLKL